MQKVLVVDDEPEIRQMLIRCLAREGMEGVGFADGVSLLNYIQKNNADLIILDIMMGDMDGFEVLREIRNKKFEIPVIFLSARQEEYDKVLGLGLGADDYVTKPFSPGELMARVKVQLRKKVPEPEKEDTLLTAGTLTMDIKSCRITNQGETVELSGKEFWLLKFFMEHSGQVFTKAQIYHQVWDENFEDDNTVMVYISHLRNKLGKKPDGQEWIQTIHGIGYRFGGDR